MPTRSNFFGLCCLALALWINTAPVPKAEPIFVRADPFPIARSFGCDELARTCRAAERSAKISKGTKL